MIMDMMQFILAIITLLAGSASFTEWRIRTMYQQFKEKLEDSNKINQVIQSELQKDIGRIEAKIDMLIRLQIKGYNDNHDKNI